MNSFLKFIFLIVFLFFTLLGCQSTLQDISSGLSKITPKNSIVNPNNVDESYFDLYCSSLYRNKIDLKEHIIKTNKDFFIERVLKKTINWNSNISHEDLLNEYIDYQSESFISLFFYQPILPDLLEDFIYRELFEKSLFEKMNILDPEEHKKYYNYLKKVQKKIIERFSNKSNINYSVPEIKIYIYDDGTRSINAFAIPPRYILISKEIIKKALLDYENSKAKKRSNQSKKSHMFQNKSGFNDYSINLDLNRVNFSEIFLEFVIAHEIHHFLKKHHTLKTQYFIINPYLDANRGSLKELKTFLLSQPSFELIDSKISHINSINHRRLYNLMSFLELEADACAAKVLLDIYGKNRDIIYYFFNKEFEKYFLGDFIQTETIQNNQLIRMLDNISQFIKNYLNSESELHLTSSQRKNHILRTINSSLKE